MSSNHVEELLGRMSNDMRLAMKNKNKIEVDELRSLIARINNAEAQPIELGISGTETQGKQLTLNDVNNVITEEENEIQAAIMTVGLQSEYTAVLSQKLRIAQRYK